ncbi:MAG: preprotein translocase subunit SecG [Planctomycetota bacterium]
MLPAPTPILAEISWTVTLLAAAFVLVSLFMMLVILIQKPKGGGLSGAFGGAGGGETSFVGAKVGDFLTILTVGCFIAFLLLAMALTWKINPTENQARAAAVLQQTTGTAGGDASNAQDEADADADDDTTPPSLDGAEAMTDAAADDAEEPAPAEAGEAPTSPSE